jgi:hypothetical protein
LQRLRIEFFDWRSSFAEILRQAKNRLSSLAQVVFTSHDFFAYEITFSGAVPAGSINLVNSVLSSNHLLVAPLEGSLSDSSTADFVRHKEGLHFQRTPLFKISNDECI